MCVVVGIGLRVRPTYGLKESFMFLLSTLLPVEAEQRAEQVLSHLPIAVFDC